MHAVNDSGEPGHAGEVEDQMRAVSFGGRLKPDRMVAAQRLLDNR